MNPKEKKEFEEIKRFVNNLKNANRIPLAVDQSFRKRFNIDSISFLEASAKAATSENRTVSESGSSTYSVLKPPQGFLQFISNGTAYYIPFFTAP